MRVTLTKKGKGLEKLLALADQAKRRPFVKVGVLGKTAVRDLGLDNVALAVTHEFGVPGRIPSRPFLRSTFDLKRDDWGNLLARLITKALKGSITVEQVLGLIGQRASADVRNRITVGTSPFVPNAPFTIAQKGSSRPLVDTGRLVQSISYQVVSR
ncbi:MAG: hypothetical protein ACOZQL_10680 [Myxococcota bacterium]